MKEQDSENKKDPVEQIQEKPAKDEFLIVGIGASAGGIQALQEFFRQVPEDSGMAYVVILHLSPDHESHLAHVLQREAKIPVTQVIQRIHIQPNNIYVISPAKHLTMEDGYIAVTDNTLMEERRAPVDIFFRTLADEHGPRAVAVILSGTGANGSMGLKRVKERGGACFVQNPREAEFNEMPRNAIDTNMVDEVLSVSKIPGKILSFKASLGSVAITDEIEKRPEDQQQALREIFTQIRVRTGHDFSNYKRPTLLRRIERRINIRNLPDLPSYAKYLVDNHDEPIALLKDLLISVTNFFRDKKPFEIIEHEVLPIIFKDKNHEHQVRIWVAGCATGEEAYSMAMLCAEKTIGIDAPKVQIFATDIDEAAIAVAREGLYSLNDAADVSPERLRRFFNKEGDNYRVRREIREMILFATHNFLKDPPFSHLDLISCRNVMIYLNQVAQERIIETFHFALNPAAYLFLGTSESVDGASDLYSFYNRESHIYQSRQVMARAYPIPETTPALYFDQFKKSPTTQESENKILERISFGDLHQQLLEQYAPPSIVVNEEYDILHLTERAGKYLQISGGELSKNLLKLVKPELRLELRSALYQAMQRQSAVEARGLKVNADDKTETVNIHVRPVLRSGDVAKGFILILFEPTTDDSNKEILLSADEPLAKQLEEELIRVKAQLKAASEQHDFQAEEMKASNEELQAMNEELRSAAEELETSKEELQSINEELRTVNQELKVKIEETSIASNNLQNLINSTDIGTIFLDRSSRVVLFTPAARNIFNLIPADHGRPLSDITHKLEYNELLADTEAVLDKLTTIEKEVRTKDGKIFLTRLTPYRTDEDRIKGVVITFVEITAQKQVQQQLRMSEERLQKAISIETVGVIFFNNDIQITDCNDAFLRMSGYTREELRAGRFSWEAFTPEEFIGASHKAIEELKANGITMPYEKQYIRKDGTRFWAVFAAKRISENEVVEFVTDITEQKEAEEKVSISEEKYRTLFDKMDDGFCSLEVLRDEKGEVTDVRIMELNPALERHTGLKHEQLVGKTMSELYPQEDIQRWMPIWARIADTGKPETVVEYANIVDRWFETSGFRENRHRVCYFFRDVTMRKKAEMALRENEEKQVFLLRLSDAIRPLTASAAIQTRAMSILGKELKSSRAQYYDAEPDGEYMIGIGAYADGIPPVFERVRIDDLGEFVKEDFQAGKTTVVTDAFDDPRISDEQAKSFKAFSFQAFVGVPLVKEGRFVGCVGVHQNTKRIWTKHEIALVEETAERTWAAVQSARAEEALRESEETFRSYVTASSDVIYKMSADWKTMYTMNGKELLASAANSTSWMNTYIPKHEKKKVQAAINSAIRNKTMFELEYQVINAEGGLSCVYSRAVPRMNEQGEIIEWTGAASDITLRKDAENAIRTSETQLRALVENLPGGAVFIVDKDLRYLLAEGEALMATGVRPEDFVGHLVTDVIPLEDKKTYIKNYKTALAGKPFEHEHQLGNRTYFSRGVPLAGADGKVYAVLAISYDITERKKAEEALLEVEKTYRDRLEKEVEQQTADLKESNTSLRYANENLQQFASIASHDLQEPLRKLKLFSSVLNKMGDGIPGEAREVISKIGRTSERMRQLITEMLQYSRVAYGAREFATTDLNLILENVLADLDLLLHETGGTVVYPSPLPRIDTMPLQMNQLFYNLLTNALKFRKPGVTPVITITWSNLLPADVEAFSELHAGKAYVEVVFSDNGIGFNPAYAEQIFQIFERLHSVEEYEGTGIGLALCKKIVENHHGYIYARSVEGEGASFHVLLPTSQSGGKVKTGNET